MTLKLKDSVVIKPGVKDPDLNICIEDWLGRISEIDDNLVCVDWDSVTLKNMEAFIITRCEQEGLDWTQMYVLSTDVTKTKPRDKLRDVNKAIEELNAKYAWVSFGEEGERIQAMLSGIRPDDEESILRTWKNHLNKELKFPIKAEVAELMERGILQVGDKVVIEKLVEFVDETRGLFARVTDDNSDEFEFPMADLEVLDKKSKNYQLINDYAIWYANRGIGSTSNVAVGIADGAKKVIDAENQI